MQFMMLAQEIDANIFRLLDNGGYSEGFPNAKLAAFAVLLIAALCFISAIVVAVRREFGAVAVVTAFFLNAFAIIFTTYNPLLGVSWHVIMAPLSLIIAVLMRPSAPALPKGR